MPLSEGYGVLVGEAAGHGPERRRGPRPHHHLLVRAAGEIWDVAINVLADGPTAVRWLQLDEIGLAELGPAARFGQGFHRLAPEPDSGALDVLRHPALAAARDAAAWHHLHDRELGNRLRRMLAESRRVLVFGEPYVQRLGVHNVHVNQGDPDGTQWAQERGTWQDGALVVVHDGTATVLLLRFADQSLATDADGAPLDPRSDR